MCKNVYDFLLTVEPLTHEHKPAITAMLEHDSLDGFKWICQGYSDVSEFIKHVLFRDHVNNGFYWVLRFGNAIVGFAGFRYDSEEDKYLTKSYVTPAARGMGIASNITKCLVVLANLLDIELYSRVSSRNERSLGRLNKLVSDGKQGTANGKVYYLLDDVGDKEMEKYHPVIFALSEKMHGNLRTMGYISK